MRREEEGMIISKLIAILVLSREDEGASFPKSYYARQVWIETRIVIDSKLHYSGTSHYGHFTLAPVPKLNSTVQMMGRYLPVIRSPLH